MGEQTSATTHRRCATFSMILITRKTVPIPLLKFIRTLQPHPGAGALEAIFQVFLPTIPDYKVASCD